MKTICFIAILLGLYALTSCESMGGNNEPARSPEETMNGFIEKIKANDFQGAKEFTSNTTDAVMDFMKTRIEMLKQMNKEDQIAALFGGIDLSQDIKITCKTTSEDKTTCNCCEEITENCKDIVLIKEGGKWLIDQPKESTVEQ